MLTTTYKKSAKKHPHLHDWQPKAYALQFAGDCPNCKRPTLVSYLLADHLRHRVDLSRNGEVWEDCGYYCDQCRWGNAGARLVEDKE